MRGGSTGFYIFLLMLVIILVTYYLGTVSDVNAFGTQFGNLANILTGRTTSGQVSGYAS